MKPEEARNKIVEFVTGHQGCTAQDIVDGVKDAMSRTPTFFYIGELVEEKILEDKRLNRRGHRYFVVSANPLVLATRELDELEVRFTRWIDEIRNYYNQLSLLKTSNRNEISDQEFEIWRATVISINTIFSHIVNTYTTKALSSWSQLSNDKEFLDKLYSTLFSRLHRMMSHVSRALPHLIPEMANRTIGKWRWGSRMDLNSFRETRDYWHKYQLDNREFNNLMTTIWKISKDVIPAENHKVGWKKVFDNPDKYP